MPYDLPMSNVPSPDSAQPNNARPVLLWRADTDESRVEPTVERAASFLDVPPDSVMEAITSGQVLSGWFVDWEVSQPPSTTRS